MLVFLSLLSYLVTCGRKQENKNNLNFSITPKILKKSTPIVTLFYFKTSLFCISLIELEHYIQFPSHIQFILHRIGIVYPISLKHKIHRSYIQFVPQRIVIIPSQMEVAPLHCTVDITQKRRLFKNMFEFRIHA